MLPALDPAPAPIARRRPHVVVEGGDVARTARRADDVRAVRVVGTHDPVVVEKIDVGRRHRAFEHLEAIGAQRAPLRARQAPRVVNRHLPVLKIETRPVAVVALTVPAREHLAIAIERVLDRRRQIPEFAGANRLGLYVCSQIHREFLARATWRGQDHTRAL